MKGYDDIVHRDDKLVDPNLFLKCLNVLNDLGCCSYLYLLYFNSKSLVNEKKLIARHDRG